LLCMVQAMDDTPALRVGSTEAVVGRFSFLYSES